MSGNRGIRRTSKTPGGYKFEPSGRVHMFDKTYVGFVKDNKDAIKMGRLKVWIPEFSADPIDENKWFTVNYCSPFAGATKFNDSSQHKGGTTLESTQQSYGWWGVPPDLENEVVVMFINGDPNRGIWVGCLYQQFMNHMVPGIASAASHQEGEEGVDPPVAEYNKRADDINDTEPVRPRFDPLHEGLRNEGLYVDSVRGPSSASARRAEEGDGPALVYGLKSPKGNHLYIDDAGEGLIRIRTAHGAQIMINNEVGYVYMITKNGNSWMELSDDGIDMYSSKSISMRAHGDINMHADGNINQYAAGSMNSVGQKGGTASYHSGFNLLTDQLNLTSAGSVNIYSPERVSISGPSVGIAASDEIAITSGGDMGITSGGKLSVVGKKIKQNSGKGPTATVEPIKQESASGSGSSGGSGGGNSSSSNEPGGSFGGGGASNSFGQSSGSSNTGTSGTGVVPAEGTDRADRAMRYFMSMGWTKEQAAGIVGNLQVESYPNLNHNATLRDSSGSTWGIAQWRGSRKVDFRRTFGKPIEQSTFEEQLQFVQHELQDKEKAAARALRGATSAEEAARVVEDKYERAKGAKLSQRIANAKALASRQYEAVDQVVSAPSLSSEAGENGASPDTGPEVGPAPNEPTSSGNAISGPIEASTPKPSMYNDRELNVEDQFPPCQTFTTVSRLVTHEPFELHPTSSSDAVTGPLGGGSVATDPEGSDDPAVQPVDDDIIVPDDGSNWVYPTNGLTGSQYGMRVHPTTGKRSMHTGVDIRQTPTGTPIVAAKAGTVSFSGYQRGYGNIVIIKHPDGVSTFYGHCSKLHVKVGQKVSAGQHIAAVGSTGRSTGPHLHFEVRVNNQHISPSNVLPKMGKRGNKIRAGESAPKRSV